MQEEVLENSRDLGSGEVWGEKPIIDMISIFLQGKSDKSPPADAGLGTQDLLVNWIGSVERPPVPVEVADLYSDAIGYVPAI
mmetsp:Transcript_1816/g.4000  ORF Transcript_1816/g.4000 Transcript_1816/m.4000 type:complete len:82 (+) Transcript_1816:327-572(+)